MQRGAELRYHAVQHGRGTVHDAAVQAVGGVCAQQAAGMGFQLHLGQLRGVLYQRRQRALRPGQDSAAHQRPGSVHGQQGGGGIKVDDHQRGLGTAQRTHDRAKQLAAQLGRVVHADAHAAFQPGTDFHDRGLAHLAQCFPDAGRQRGHHAGEDDSGDLLRLGPVQRQHVYHFIEQLVAAQRSIRKQPRGKHQLAIRRITAKGNVGVPDIQCQDHAGPSFYR